MSKAKRKVKRLGRPPSGGSGMPLLVRMHKPQIAKLDQWKRNSDISRPEAIRQLVDWALDRVPS